MHRCASYVFVDEYSAPLQLSVKYEMYVCIHKREGKDINIYTPENIIYAVHSVYKIRLIPKHRLHAVAVCVKMPTIEYRIINTFHKWLFYTKIFNKFIQTVAYFL